jgi:hypothetical protein
MSVDEIQRAICHEAGHATAALHLGFLVDSVSVNRGIPICDVSLDTPDRSQHERFVVLTGGIAAERQIYGRYNPTACVKDRAMIVERGGQSIDTYLAETQRIIELNDRGLRRLIWKLTCKMQEELGSDSFAAGGTLAQPDLPTFVLLSSDDIQSMWRETGDPLVS